MITGIVAQGQVVRLLGQNQPYGYVNEINFSLRNFAGAFRLKAWNNSPSPAPNLNKSVEELAREVIAGKYGNGDARRNALGARFNEVQAKVNELLATPAPAPQQPAPRPSYIVQAGDTLGQIIVSQGWTNGRELWGPNGAVEQIARHNGIANANLISVGQRIERDY